MSKKKNDSEELALSGLLHKGSWVIALKRKDKKIKKERKTMPFLDLHAQ